MRRFFWVSIGLRPMNKKTIRIGGASGYWGDSARATPQLLAGGDLDYIVYDYLAEITMSILARARAKNPAAGFATDFLDFALQPNLGEITRQGVKIIANAGGVNPLACAAAVRELLDQQDISLQVACVTGDDLMPLLDEFANEQITEMFSGDACPAKASVQSVNAYLGAFPIANALDRGADIVITGRCVDSAVTLAAGIHSFGWQRDDYDLLAAGSLCGHILECGTQATGGNFTDWELLQGAFENTGYPIAELAENGDFVCSKAEPSAGLVSVATVAEQMLYEIGDPQAYLLPDVVCDFSNVTMDQLADDRVLVSGARGYPAPNSYKVSATVADQFRGGTQVTFYGIDAARKAQAFAEACLRSASVRLEQFGLSDFSETSIDVLGAEAHYGAFAQQHTAREVVLKLAAKHEDALGIGLFLKEIAGLGLAGPPGLCGFAGGRPKPSPVVRLFSFLLPKERVAISVDCNGKSTDCSETTQPTNQQFLAQRPHDPPSVEEGQHTVPLVKLAYARSGDKGNKANIGVIARKPQYLPYIYSALTTEVVAERFAHFLNNPSAESVERFLLPGIHAINYLLHDVLGGGGVASLRSDPQGKGFAQLLLDVPIPIGDKVIELLKER